MIIQEDVRKCVAFIGLRKADGTYELKGSAFFVGRSSSGGTIPDAIYAVTARHVIDRIRATAVEESWFRVNNKNGNSEWWPVALANWFTHPTDKSIDVAVLPVSLTRDLDHLIIPQSLCGNEETMVQNQVGLGEEVFVTGLFRHHHGSRKNIPIVRIGNLACMSEEKIVTKEFGDIDGYLIECRSIGGLSGSPVFVNLGTSRVLEGQIKVGTHGPQYFLLGLIHGHFDSKETEIDHLSEDASGAGGGEKINTGIAIVVPFAKIDAVISAHEATRR